MTIAATSRARFGFLLKIGAALLLIALADILFFGQWLGSTIGLFALAWAGALILVVPAVRHSRPALIALAAATGFGLVLIDDPSLLGWTLFWIALSLAALLPRRRFDDAWRWAMRLSLHGMTSIAAPIGDLRRIARVRPTATRISVRSVFPVLALPLLGGAVFIALFATANPLIGDALAAIRLPSLGDYPVLRVLFWTIVLVAVWCSFRPRRFVSRIEGSIDAEVVLPGVSVASITLSLIVFNVIFAVENALDLLFLWSRAPLPEGVTLADYAHRGAYPLIVTALLAGLFVLITLRPGSETARQPLIRRLVTLWVGQNLLLVASSILRTLDYIGVYSLTVLRLSAILWMLLVAVGLALICWRMLSGRSAAWLINANALAAAIVLAMASVVDLGAVSAAWNVRHAREIDGSGAALDLCYLNHLGDSALLPLVELERGARDPGLRDRVTWLRERVLDDVAARQADWHGWTWRNARRLAAAREILGDRAPRAARAPHGRNCDGRRLPPPAIVEASDPMAPVIAAPAPSPLTRKGDR